jgi:hypothetical protein
MMDKLLNTEYELNPSTRSGKNETHVHRDTQSYSRHSETDFSRPRVLNNCKLDKILTSIFFVITIRGKVVPVLN